MERAEAFFIINIMEERCAGGEQQQAGREQQDFSAQNIFNQCCGNLFMSLHIYLITLKYFRSANKDNLSKHKMQFSNNLIY